MGMISSILGLGGLIREGRGVAEAIVGNKAEEARAQHDEFVAVLNELSKEFEQPRTSWFDALVDGLNRLPRPALAMGTLGLFVYAMVDPIGFSSRMVGLELVPDPLWWLLGAIVSFYFGARELHYLRDNRPALRVQDIERVTGLQERIEGLRPRAPEPAPPPVGATAPVSDPPPAGVPAREAAPAAAADPADPDANAALEEWLRLQA